MPYNPKSKKNLGKPKTSGGKITITLSPEAIEWLSRQKNKSGTIDRLIRGAIAKEQKINLSKLLEDSIMNEIAQLPEDQCAVNRARPWRSVKEQRLLDALNKERRATVNGVLALLSSLPSDVYEEVLALANLSHNAPIEDE